MSENANARFERLAAEFQRDTGMMAPGKDQPAEMGGPPYAERWRAWDAWLAARAVVAGRPRNQTQNEE